MELNREEILQIALECGADCFYSTEWKQDGYSYNGKPMFTEVPITESCFAEEQLERFAHRIEKETLLKAAKEIRDDESGRDGNGYFADLLVNRAEQIGKE